MDNKYFEVSPRIVQADTVSEITIRPLFDHVRLDADTEYTVTIYPAEERAGRGAAPESVFKLKPVGGELHVRQLFAGEQEHTLYVERAAGAEKFRIGDFRIYSLEADLFARRPYKGDLHIHSNQSDGRESPAYVAAACRRIGLDFMAVTDHHKYEPSLEAQRAFADVPVDLAIFPGEEVHHREPFNPVHIINFGGRFSVNALQAEKATYLAEVAAIEATLSDPALNPSRRTNYAQCLWTYQKIRESGGLGIFCHPYWVEGHRYNVSEPLIARHFADQPFDAYEVIGGFHRYETGSNVLQVARYHDERARGRQLPIVGVSDAHGCETGELFGWYYTIVFAASTELPVLISGVKELFSVAVEVLPGAPAHVHGPHRLVAYALFLMREVFPAHDALCHEEGSLMLAHAAGDPQAASSLARRQGSTRALYDRYWARR